MRFSSSSQLLVYECEVCMYKWVYVCVKCVRACVCIYVCLCGVCANVYVYMCVSEYEYIVCVIFLPIYFIYFWLTT